MSIQFGTDGLRGRAGEDPITVKQAFAVGVAAGRWALSLSPAPTVLIAHDPRHSSPAFSAAVVAGVTATGATAGVIGMVPTPVLGTALAAGLGHVGVMVTASHNPAPDNGFKVLGPGGAKPLGAQVAQLEAYMEEPVHDMVPGAVQAMNDQALAAWDLAVAAVLPALPKARLVVDLANGAGTAMQERLRRLWPGELHVVGTEGLVNDGVGSEHLANLGAAVLRVGAWAGLAIDGDGDRCRLVDAAGEAVPGDAVTWLLAKGMGVKKLAVTVMSTTALELQLPGVEVVRTAVGDKHLAAAMREHGLPLGAEESGHVLFSDFPAGDGLVAGLRALAAIGDRPMNEALAGFKPLPRRLGKLRVGGRPPLEQQTALQDVVRAVTPVLGDGGRVFLRYSGTEPVLRILIEGATEGSVNDAYQRVEAAAIEVLR